MVALPHIPLPEDHELFTAYQNSKLRPEKPWISPDENVSQCEAQQASSQSLTVDTRTHSLFYSLKEG